MKILCSRKFAVCFRESGLSEVPPSFEEQLNSNFYYLRDGKWKYTFCGNYPQCEWLIDLEDAGDFQINLKYQYPDERNKYHEMIKRKFSAAQDFHYLPGLGFENIFSNKAEKCFHRFFMMMPLIFTYVMYVIPIQQHPMVRRNNDKITFVQT